VGFASSRRLMLLGLFHMALRKSRLAFMATTEAEARQRLIDTQPGVLFLTAALEEGSGLTLVEAARNLVPDVRTILIVDAANDDLVAAGRSCADAVVCEADCFEPEEPMKAMIRSLALNHRYRSSTVLAALEAAAVTRDSWRDGAPDLNAREREQLELLLKGLPDREISEQLQISYETARSRTKGLRRKLGASTRAQMVAKALQLGLDQLRR
jgi:DNA-binding NarL/FixJ family response regulator